MYRRNYSNGCGYSNGLLYDGFHINNIFKSKTIHFSISFQITRLSVVSQLNERCVYLLALLIPSITFLLFYQSSYMPALYIVQIYSQTAVIAAVALKSILSEYSMKLPQILPKLLYSSLAMNFLRCIFGTYEMFFKLSGPIEALRTFFNVTTYLFMLIAFVLWMFRTVHSTNRFAIEQSIYSDSEYHCMVLNAALLLYALLIIVANVVFVASTWSNTNESSLASYAYFQLAFTIAVTGNHLNSVIV